MGGLSYPPFLESEVLVLFGMLIPHLNDEFVIKEFNSSPGFPDCFALRNGREVGIEFEVDSRNFYEHKHHVDPNIGKCNLIVCWRNVLGPSVTVIDKFGKEHRIEIIELEKIVKEKSLTKLLFPIEKKAVPSEWNEKAFLEKLKKKAVDERVHNWIKELIDACKQSSEFAMAYGKGKRQATLGFHVKKWLSQGIGDPTPIQFSDNGEIIFVCRKMDKNPEIEKELRNKIDSVRSKKWRVWCSIPIKDEKTFTTIKEIINWLSDTTRKIADNSFS